MDRLDGGETFSLSSFLAVSDEPLTAPSSLDHRASKSFCLSASPLRKLRLLERVRSSLHRLCSDPDLLEVVLRTVVVVDLVEFLVERIELFRQRTDRATELS